MKFLKRFFSPKTTEVKDKLYRELGPGEFLDYDENHEKESYTQSEIDQINLIFDKVISGQNSTNCITIAKKSPIGGVSIFFSIEKFKDEWFIAHKCKINDMIEMSGSKGKFKLLNTYLCDSLEGVKNCVKEMS